MEEMKRRGGERNFRTLAAAVYEAVKNKLWYKKSTTTLSSHKRSNPHLKPTERTAQQLLIAPGPPTDSPPGNTGEDRVEPKPLAQQDQQTPAGDRPQTQQGEKKQEHQEGQETWAGQAQRGEQDGADAPVMEKMSRPMWNRTSHKMKRRRAM